MIASLVVIGTLVVPLVMALGLFLILRWGKEEQRGDDAEVPEER